MLVYAEEKKDFMTHVRDNQISDMVELCMKRKLGRSVGASERRSWQNSLNYMRNILDDNGIPDDAGVAIEYNIPQTSNRIDFIISGYDSQNSGNLVIIEMKQWETASLTRMDATVNVARFGDISHPSYQAWSYKALMEDFNEAVRESKIELHPCAYLHNCNDDNVILNPFYDKWLREAPAFLKNDNEKLRSFIKKYIKLGDKKELLFTVESGKIKPSKCLADSLASMLNGNQEFILIDEQKVVYETALQKAEENEKNVLIIRGGPGTGKTVVAINLLVELTKRKKLVQYVTSNAAPRAIYEAKLTGTLNKTRISNLFKGATVYQNESKNTFDALVVDEAHRLSERNLLNTYKGNQVRDVINAARLTVFFLDETQKVLIEDVGNEEEIKKWANKLGAKLTVMDLPLQFRCNGSSGYLAWLDNTLGIRETANYTLSGIDYDFRVVDSPSELHRMIREKNAVNNNSRLVAGYCWRWASKKDPKAKDIQIGDYSAQWNKSDDDMHWAIKPGTIDEVGCIHTCQGLEFEYIGVIIGNDMVARNDNILTQPDERDSVDANKTLRGYRKRIANTDPRIVAETIRQADEIIKNTYKVLMTRGQKGCYVYCCDEELKAYLKDKLSGSLL